MENKKSGNGKAKLFHIKHLPMDLGRLVCCTMPLWFRLKKIYVSETAKQKLKGGALIAANHTCFADPLMLGCCFWYRRMFFLAAEVVMKNKFLQVLLKGIGCVEINRNICDIEAIRKSVSLLKEGHVMSVFPQGGIDRSGNMNEIKSGIILMAIQAKVPIIPVYIHRKAKFGERNCIVIGDPIPALNSESLAGMTDIQTYADHVFEKMTECRILFENMRRNKDGNN